MYLFKKINLFVLLSFLVFISCKKDQVINEPITVDPEPEVVVNGSVSGVVMDVAGEPLVNALVRVGTHSVYIGLDLQYQFKSGIYLKSGVAYEQVTERLDFQRVVDEEMFYNENALGVIYKLANGSTENGYGAHSTRKTLQTRIIYNRYRSVDVPFAVGYHSNSKKRWNWFTEGGVLINIGFVAHGEILDIDDETIIDLSGTDILKSTIGVGLHAGIGMSYSLDEKWSLWVSPRFRYALSSMTTDEYALKQSFVRGVLQIGVRRSL